MADEDDLLEEGEEKKGGGSKMLLIIAMVNTLGLLGLGAFVVLGMNQEKPAEDDQALAESTEGETAKKPMGEPGPTLELGTLVVNLRWMALSISQG